MFHHDVVGDLELAYESVDMISDPGLTLTIYAAEPASPTAHALELLASWTAEQLPDAPTSKKSGGRHETLPVSDVTADGPTVLRTAGDRLTSHVAQWCRHPCGGQGGTRRHPLFHSG